ncbi:MAG: CAAD domain-containing protein [Cyanobacteriota bacterium]|jgi:hypothetical protein|nr:CAAD domain-containing protein [Cyanobacteriota bacterium]
MVDTPSTPGGTSGGSSAGGEPTLAGTTILPPSEPAAGAGGDGGEWELLVSKVRSWFASGQAATTWGQARSSLPLLAAIAGALLLLKVYGALLAAINGIPLLPGLLELVAVVWLLQNGAPRLIRRQERQQLFDQLGRRWQAFRGP